MAKTKAKAAIPNWKKKKWYELLAPQIYGEKVLGESLAESPEHIKGKVVTVNLMTLLGNPRKQNISVKLRVEKVEGNKGLTKPIKLGMSHVSVKRLIRSGKDRVDSSFVAKTKGDTLLRIKPLIITKSCTSNSVKTALRHKAQEVLTTTIATLSLDSVFDSVTRGNLQKDLKDVLDKIYPLKMADIRVVEIELTNGERVIQKGDLTNISAPKSEKTIDVEVKETVESEAVSKEEPVEPKKAVKKVKKAKEQDEALEE